MWPYSNLMGYKALDRDDDDGSQPDYKYKNPSVDQSASCYARILPVAATVLASLILGFFAGRFSLSTASRKNFGLLAPMGEIEQAWELNDTFASAPSVESENAWHSIAPVGRGFITHPSLAPFVSNIAVFHQLHCLDGIRVSYYYAIQQAQNNSTPTESEDFVAIHGRLVDREHIRHCFDYLRRAIMCSADTNLEPVSRDNRITTGWGSFRLCRDYDSVKSFAEQWANSSDTGLF